MIDVEAEDADDEERGSVLEVMKVLYSIGSFAGDSLVIILLKTLHSTQFDLIY